jgi:hypothetical protein
MRNHRAVGEFLAHYNQYITVFSWCQLYRHRPRQHGEKLVGLSCSNLRLPSLHLGGKIAGGTSPIIDPASPSIASLPHVSS